MRLPVCLILVLATCYMQLPCCAHNRGLFIPARVSLLVFVHTMFCLIDYKKSETFHWQRSPNVGLVSATLFFLKYFG
jgi:hypothetical protein